MLFQDWVFICEIYVEKSPAGQTTTSDKYVVFNSYAVTNSTPSQNEKERSFQYSDANQTDSYIGFLR